MDRIVVVGAGQAGASLCARLRAKGYTGALTLIGAEPVPPYQRPPLSKAYLLGEMPVESAAERGQQRVVREIQQRLGGRAGHCGVVVGRGPTAGFGGQNKLRQGLSIWMRAAPDQRRTWVQRGPWRGRGQVEIRGGVVTVS